MKSNTKNRAAENRRFLARIERYRRLIEAEVQDIDPHDLDLILWSLLKPKSDGRTFLVKPIRDNVYVR